LHIIDTAGLREATDKVEQIGIERAWQEILQADRVLFMVDSTTTAATDPAEIWPDFIAQIPPELGISVIRNKADLTGEPVGGEDSGKYPLFRLSAKDKTGLDALREHLKACMGFETGNEGSFIARRRHLDALARASEHLSIGEQQLHDHLAGELLAEELRLTQQHLNEITGEFSSDDLLGRIFSSFCIGK
jgi:tRNA modification GTPase